MLKQLLLYEYNDMSLLFYGFEKYQLPQNFLILSRPDWVFSFIAFFFVELFSTLQGFNLLTLTFLTLSFISCLFLFKKINKKNVPLSIIFSYTYSFSIYYLYRVQSFTPNLYPIFIFPLIVFMLIRQSKVILVSLLISLFTIVSSYYAFFGGVVVLLWYFFNREFKRLSMFVIFCVVFTGILNFNLILKNVPFLSGFSENIQAHKVERPIEDWYNFSIKPWYFVIPPKNSTFFSEFSNDIHLRIYNTGYYLAQSYSEDEMGGVFIGWHFALGIIFMLVYFFHKKLNNKLNQYFENLNKNKNLILYCLFSMFVIFLISSPPSITIKGYEIFTPSYLLFQVVPFFRALSRWGIVIFLLVLVINFILYADLLNLIKRKFYRIVFYTLIIIINFLMFSVNLNIIDIKDLPSEISFLNQSGSKVYVSIPMDYYSIFWGSYISPFILENEFEKRPVFKDEAYEIFNPNLQMLKQIDTVVLYKNELNIDEISDIQKINPEIRSLQDVENYLISNFGNIVYEDEKSKIFSN